MRVGNNANAMMKQQSFALTTRYLVTFLWLMNISCIARSLLDEVNIGQDASIIELQMVFQQVYNTEFSSLMCLLHTCNMHAAANMVM